MLLRTSVVDTNPRESEGFGRIQIRKKVWIQIQILL
jgi:hypothetical protein